MKTKTIISVFACLFLVFITSFNSAKAQYCIPTYTNPCTIGSPINRVEFAGIDNSPAGTGCNGNPNNYIFYSNDTAIVAQGGSYPITLTGVSIANHSFGVWIDFNADNDFADTGEFVFSSAVGFNPVSGFINIPVSASIGNTRMRVRNADVAIAADDSCSNKDYGETEDYIILIQAQPPDDAGVIAIDAPTSGCGLSATDSVTVRVYNFGSAAQSNIPVSFDDGTGPVAEIIPGPLNPGDTLSYTFSATSDLSVQGIYVFDAWTSLVGDADNGNDSVTYTVLNNCYCIPVYTNDCSEFFYFIDRVEFAGIDNSPAGTGCNGNADNYIFYSDIAIVAQDSSYPITLTPDAFSWQGFGVWIDFNADNDFADAGEFVFSSAPVIVPVSDSITIPVSATPGNTRMRVRSIWSVTPVAGDFCNNQDYGETEDYHILIQGSSPCSITSSFISSATVIYEGATVNFTNTSTGAITYEWQENGTPFSTAVDTSRTFNIAGNYTISLIADSGSCSDSSGVIITVNEQDTIPPSCLPSSPPFFATGVAINAPVFIAFDEAIDTILSVPTPLNPDPGGVNWIWNATLDTITATHNDFAYSTTYDATFPGFADTSGNWAPFGCGVFFTTENPPANYDVGVITIYAPVSGCALTAADSVTISVTNFDVASQDTIPVSYSINGGLAVNDTIFAILNSGDTITFTFAITADLSAPDSLYIFDAWTSLIGDANNINDSTLNDSVIHFASPIVNLPDTTICDGDSVIIFGVYRKIDGTYYDTLLTINSCDSVITTTLIVNPLPVISVTPDPGLICIAGTDSVTLTASGAVSYTWSPAVGLSAVSGSSVNASPPNDTVYTVVGTGANGCIDSTTVSVQISTISPVASFSSSITSVCEGNTVTFNNTSTDAIGFSWTFPGGTTADTTIQNPVVTYNTSGIFDVTLTALGCSTDSTITMAGYITVNLSYSIITPDDTICDGDSIMIFGIFRSIADTYFNYLITINGCDSTIITTLIVNSLPIVDLGADTTICNGCSVTLNAGAGFTSYIWSNGETTQTIIVDSTGTYSVMVTDANGCSGGDTIVVNVVTGINQLSFINNQLKVYPNPNTGEFIIEMNITKAIDLEIKLLDVIGKVIYQEKLNKYVGAYQNKIYVGEYAKGIYNLQFISEKGTINKKIVVE